MRQLQSPCSSRRLKALLGVLMLAGAAQADGLNPGSLLIYPEYDTTGGRDTLITVTNVSSSDTVSITFEYINTATTGPTFCLQTDRHATLTPHDTLTVLVSNHIGTGRKGFAYVFASNAAGDVALSNNSLIGDDLVLDATITAGYSIVPLVFKAKPSPNNPTDLDGDGLRDLNNAEYESGPARILIPRFMGQHSGHASELILIGLSGGARFTTLADFVIFNDNEVPLSAQYSFPCWKKVSLLSISGVFGRSFLANNTADAPLEIIGQSTYEAGWFLVEGHIAQSTSATILNPTILAVLVETAGSRPGAEIPFLQERRNTGALWPVSVGGGGP